MNKSDILIIIAGAIVPGKYIRAMPISVKETCDIASRFSGTKILGGAAAKFGFGGTGGTGAIDTKSVQAYFDYICKGDIDACVYDYLKTGSLSDRNRTGDEWNKWSVKGAEIVMQHPDFPQPLITEIETYRGCVRYFTNGCSFCIEPLFGEPIFRQPADIVQEIEALYKVGIVNFRLGAQSCFFSYCAKGIGESETPVPNVGAIKSLFTGIYNVVPKLEVLHLDNANPAVIAEHKNESTEIIKLICEYCTPGNTVAFGMESADPKVIRSNNLNATPCQVMTAIELINKYGYIRGQNGMPLFLPGINLLYGLKGESKFTFELNLKFLHEVMDKKLLLRRINIRQVMALKNGFDQNKYYNLFRRYKIRTRNEIDNKMLQLIVPKGIILRNVFIEKIIGKTTFGRQIGTYPLLVGIPYGIEKTGFIDVYITDHGDRSVTGVEYPFDINHANLRALESLPFIGSKRAVRLKMKQPINSSEDLIEILDDPEIALKIIPLLKFSRG